ncbi:MAG: ACT domain-containing protein [Halobacteriota archaeon]
MTDHKMLKQITLFAENKPGRLTDTTRILSENGINIQAFTIADAGEFGIIRFVVDDADASLKHLRRAGFTVSETQVIGIDMTDELGAYTRSAARYQIIISMSSTPTPLKVPCRTRQSSSCRQAISHKQHGCYQSEAFT